MTLRIFTVWNQGFKPRCFAAESHDEALRLSVTAGHTRRVDRFRKYQDDTDKYIEEHPGEGLEEILAAGVSGVVEYRDGEGWTFYKPD